MRKITAPAKQIKRLMFAKNLHYPLAKFPNCENCGTDLSKTPETHIGYGIFEDISNKALCHTCCDLFVSEGAHNTTKGAKNNILDVLKSVNEATSAEQVRIGIATSTGMVSMNGEEIPVGFGKMGNIFTVTMATPNRKQRFLKLNPSKLSAEHAQLVFLALQQAYTKGRGGFKAKFEAPNVEGLSIGDFLSLMVYYGEKDTKYLASNTSNSAKAYLKDKQLYVGNKGKTLFFGQFNMPLHNPTESGKSISTV